MNHHAEPKAESESRGQETPGAAELHELRHRLALAPHNTELRLHMAQWLAERGRRQEALEELRALVQIDPNHLVARKLREELLRRDAEPVSDSSEPPRAEALH